MDWGVIAQYLIDVARAILFAVFAIAAVGVCGYAWGRGWVRGVVDQLKDKPVGINIDEYADGTSKRIEGYVHDEE